MAYYDHNVAGSLRLLEAMRRAGVYTLVFSSSSTVYGDPASVPIREDFPLGATNPYGWSKFMVEQVLADVVRAEPDWRIARLRYFNPVGAHESGLIGEDPSGIPNNLMPFIAQVATGQRSELQIFGGDWPTPDGTGVRDYIHVMDLAEGHVAALGKLAQQPGLLTLNLGTGSGVSVLEMVAAFERACGRKLPYRIVARRPGDIAACWADPSEAERVLGWRTRPGRHRFPSYRLPGEHFHKTILPDGSRAAAPDAGPARPELVLVGCSYTLGWAVDDSDTWAWRLQQHLPELRVLNS